MMSSNGHYGWHDSLGLQCTKPGDVTSVYIEDKIVHRSEFGAGI